MVNKKEQRYWFLRSKWVALSLLIAVLLFIYFVPRAIMYPDHKIVGWSIFIIIFLVIPVLVFVSLKKFNLRFSGRIAMLSVLVVGPTFGLFQGYREKIELEKNGIWSKAIVIDRKSRKRSWTMKCQFKVGNELYETLYHDDNHHSIGDTLGIIYSKKFPKIHALDYEWKR